MSQEELPIVDIDIDVFLGSRVTKVIEAAITKANKDNVRVRFEFNGTPVLVSPGESSDAVYARWNKDFETAQEAYFNSDEYKERKRIRDEERAIALAATMKESAQSETEMREAKDPKPLTETQLTEYINSLVEREHDYGTCVYAMSLAATAAFNYVASKLGVTGFQASCADLDFIRRIRHINGPFILLKGEDALYPQYNLPNKLQEALNDWQPWMKEEAQKLLAKNVLAKDEEFLSPAPAVKAHWERLAGLASKQ